MAYTLTVDHPDFPKGFPFDCDGILVENGESRTLTKEDEIAFLARWGNDVKHYYGHGTHAKLTGSSELSKKEREEVAPGEVSTGAALDDSELLGVDDKATTDEGGD